MEIKYKPPEGFKDPSNYKNRRIGAILIQGNPDR